jgi:hypothetical protein
MRCQYPHGCANAADDNEIDYCSWHYWQAMIEGLIEQAKEKNNEASK